MRGHFGNLDQEPVVAEIARNHGRAVAIECVADTSCNLVLPVNREQPVAVDPEHERARGDASERVFDATAIAPDVVRVHRIDEADVGVGVEPAGEPVAVKVEVGLNREAAAVTDRADA